MIVPRARGPLADIEDTQIVAYSDVASVTVVTYDILLTFSEEVEYIWRRPWRLTSLLYLSARYLPCITELALMKINGHVLNDVQYSSSACHEWTRLQAGMLQVIVTVVDVILLIRVHALFYDSRTFFAALIALFVAETTTLCVLVGLVGPTTVVNSHCLVTSISDLFTVYWAVSLSFQSLLFALTLFKFFVAVRAGWGRTSVLARLATDGTWAYALIFSVMFANALLYSFEHTPLAGLCFSWLLTVLSISGSRLLLDPRRMFKFKHGNGPTINTTEMEMTTSMQFAEA